jgi:Mlc titration factor MtfA (ptsG expression regulator)
MGLIRNWRRRRVLRNHAIDAQLWQRVAKPLGFLEGLSEDERRRLESLVLLFLAEKEFTAAAGSTLDDRVRLSIALQACLPILNLGLDWYDGWVGVIVYPGDFRVNRSEVDEDGVVHEWEDDLVGEAFPGGPVVLSWDAVSGARDEDEPMNVVLHEFAHKLDEKNGESDGVPPLHADMSRREWVHTLEQAYEDFCARVDRGEDTLIDPYAAEHVAEFFAVASETFFEQPNALKKDYWKLYDQFARFYRQDPARRVNR